MHRQSRHGHVFEYKEHVSEYDVCPHTRIYWHDCCSHSDGCSAWASTHNKCSRRPGLESDALHRTLAVAKVVWDDDLDVAVIPGAGQTKVHQDIKRTAAKESLNFDEPLHFLFGLDDHKARYNAVKTRAGFREPPEKKRKIVWSSWAGGLFEEVCVLRAKPLELSEREREYLHGPGHELTTSNAFPNVPQQTFERKEFRCFVTEAQKATIMKGLEGKSLLGDGPVVAAPAPESCESGDVLCNEQDCGRGVLFRREVQILFPRIYSDLCSYYLIRLVLMGRKSSFSLLTFCF